MAWRRGRHGRLLHPEGCFFLIGLPRGECLFLIPKKPPDGLPAVLTETYLLKPGEQLWPASKMALSRQGVGVGTDLQLEEPAQLQQMGDRA